LARYPYSKAPHHGTFTALNGPCDGLLKTLPQNPAFGPAQLKSLTPIFNQKASELRNIWLSQLNENNADIIEVDFDSYMGCSTLDIIGLAGWSMLAGKERCSSNR